VICVVGGVDSDSVITVVLYVVVRKRMGGKLSKSNSYIVSCAEAADLAKTGHYWFHASGHYITVINVHN
jgi:hypothetical protein